MVIFLFKIISSEQMSSQAVLGSLFKHTIYTHTALWTVVVTQAVWLEGGARKQALGKHISLH